ncbi:unnamed protein product, partial [Lymnaea stagnalis]
IVSDELLAYFETFINLWLLTPITGFGVVTNLLNILVFWRQGFKDGVNISMTTIACWDLLKCGTGLIHRMYGPVGLVSTAAAISWQNITFPVASYTPIFAGYVSYALTTYVSIERCLCVSKPFTVKALFTPRLTFCAIATISIVVFGSYVVMYFIHEIAFVFAPNFNTTVAIYRYTSFFFANQAIVMVYYKYVGILLPFASFTVLCLCSATTVYQLRKSSRLLHKEKNGTTRNSEFSRKIKSGISLREKQVVKMLLAVVMVNIGNLFPRIVFYVAQLVEPELYLLRRYHNMFGAVAVWLFVLDILKASINFFLFLSMGSLFRIKFYAMFGSWGRPGKI